MRTSDAMLLVGSLLPVLQARDCRLSVPTKTQKFDPSSGTTPLGLPGIQTVVFCARTQVMRQAFNPLEMLMAWQLLLRQQTGTKLFDCCHLLCQHSLLRSAVQTYCGVNAVSLMSNLF